MEKDWVTESIMHDQKREITEHVNNQLKATFNRKEFGWSSVVVSMGGHSIELPYNNGRPYNIGTIVLVKKRVPRKLKKKIKKNPDKFNEVI